MTLEIPYLISTRDGKLELMLSCPENPQALAIMCHPHSEAGGSMNNKVVTTAIKAWQALNFATVRFNFRSVGQSTGVFSHGVGESEDLANILDFALQQCGKLPIILGGFSFGAYVALRFCQHYQPKSLWLIAPPVSYPELSDFHLPKASHCYTIIAESDELFTLEASLAWVQKQAFTQYFVIDGASHFFHGKLLLLKELIMQHAG